MKKNYSFMKGWSQIKQGDIAIVRDKLMNELGVKTRMAFYNRLNGKVEPKVSEAKAIESVFSEYGIKDIWGQ